MAEKIVLSDKEKEIIGMLDDSLYTIEYIEEWINRNDNVFVNALCIVGNGSKRVLSSCKTHGRKKVV